VTNDTHTFVGVQIAGVFNLSGTPTQVNFNNVTESGIVQGGNYENINGVFASLNDCNAPAGGAAGVGSITAVKACTDALCSTTAGNVKCTWTNQSFTRTGPHVTVTLNNGICAGDVNSSSATVQVAAEFIPTTPPPVTNAAFAGAFTATY
jgi:hypothetical protein